MNDWQSWTALGIVLLTVAIFAWRWIRKRRKGGSGGGCDGCG